MCQLRYILYAKASSVVGAWVCIAKIARLCCMPGGRMNKEINFRSQGHEFEPEE